MQIYFRREGKIDCDGSSDGIFIGIIGIKDYVKMRFWFKFYMIIGYEIDVFDFDD